MINECRYEMFQKDINYLFPTVFLAGPTVRGNQPHLTSWRGACIEEFHKQGFSGNLIIPEFENPLESDAPRMDLPVWEFDGLIYSHCNLFWVPRTKELIGLTTNHELGYWMGRRRDKVVYGRPKDAYRTSYLDIMWVEDYKERTGKNTGVVIHTNLKTLIEAAIELAEKNWKLEHPDIELADKSEKLIFRSRSIGDDCPNSAPDVVWPPNELIKESDCSNFRTAYWSQRLRSTNEHEELVNT